MVIFMYVGCFIFSLLQGLVIINGHLSHVVLQDLLPLGLLVVHVLYTVDDVHVDFFVTGAGKVERGGWLDETNYQVSDNFNVLIPYVFLCRINISSLYLRLLPVIHVPLSRFLADVGVPDGVLASGMMLDLSLMTEPAGCACRL